jgi:hypothetical protein
MRFRSLVLSIAATVLLLSAPALAATPADPGGDVAAVALPARPAILPPETAFQVVRLQGQGVRGAGFMDYTDDACTVCDGKIIIGLSPSAPYRIAGSPDACGVPYQKATRAYAYPITASARGTYWNPGRPVSLRGSTPVVSVRVLKGSSGTVEVACGNATDLTDQTGHPLADARTVVAVFRGPSRHGIAFAIAQPDGRAKVSAVFAEIPGTGPVRLRSTTGPCSMTGAAAFTRALDVSARHTAARTETVDLNETLTVANLGSMQLGAARTPFTRVACRNVVQAATFGG